MSYSTIARCIFKKIEDSTYKVKVIVHVIDEDVKVELGNILIYVSNNGSDFQIDSSNHTFNGAYFQNDDVGESCFYPQWLNSEITARFKKYLSKTNTK